MYGKVLYFIKMSNDIAPVSKKDFLSYFNVFLMLETFMWKFQV